MGARLLLLLHAVDVLGPEALSAGAGHASDDDEASRPPMPPGRARAGCLFPVVLAKEQQCSAASYT